MTRYPDDADGAVLADLAARGVDMSKSLLIEFPVAVPDEISAADIAKAMLQAGYDARVECDEGEPDYDPSVDDPNEFGPSWTVYASITMIPVYSEIIRIQNTLDLLSRPFGGKSDGWGVMLEGKKPL
jgi:hypothetical protein